MVNTADFYKHTDVICDRLQPIVKRIMSLLDEVVERLPDEEQFKIKCRLIIFPRQIVMELWKRYSPIWKIAGPNFNLDLVGNCQYQPAGSFDNMRKLDRAADWYVITIIVDNLESKTDDYIKGLIAHELSEMSCPYRILQENWDTLKKMKPAARQVMYDKWTKANAVLGSKEYQEHEDDINNEAIRLGFQKEIDALLAKN
jgi:hypothetical protein